MRAWAQEVGHLPINITVLFEGEEESGSASLPSFLEARAEELKADVVFVCDTLMWDQQTPAITAMLRGMVAEEFTVRCANRDLHSGLYGNAARNPLNLVAQILGEMKDADGHIHIPGFYDDVAETNPEVLAQWKQLGFETDKFLGDIDLKIPAGEPDRHVLEQIWTRPTCDVNGIWGGYIEPGFKTVIPSEASAKLSFRLVTKQDPGKVQQGFRDFVEARIPADCTVSFKDHAASPAISMEASSHFMKVSDQQLAAEFGTATAFVGCGGSIPIVENFKQALGMDSILIGFGLENDNAHSPNEKYEISSFHKGTRFWARLLGVLGQA
jgi:acetylornithine deacetylase/succinyl-diaminopimelate desuccinylase-like protein